MIATVTSQGRARWMIIDDAFDAHQNIKFLAGLIKDAGKKVFQILDNWRVHHSKIVNASVAETRSDCLVLLGPATFPNSTLRSGLTRT